MAESEDSTSPPRVTRRTIVAGLAAGALPGQSPALAGPLTPTVRRAWHDWRAANRKLNAMIRRWQTLETRLARSIGMPPPGPSDHRDLWEAEAESCGMTELEEAIEAGHETAERLVERALRLPAADLGEVALKLRLLAAAGQARDDDREFPWPQVRKIIADLSRLGIGT